MDFQPNPSQLRIQELARTFARERVLPFASDWEEKGEIPEDFLLQMARQGFAAMTAPSEFGGSGLDLVSFTLALMEVSEVSPSLAQVISSNTQMCQALAAFGAPSQKRKYLPEHVAGGAIGSIALLESEGGPELSAIRTTATPTHGGYLLSGEKGPVAGASLRGVAIVGARLSSSKDGPSASGLTLFIVDKRKEGVRVAKTKRKLGLRAGGTGLLELQDCFVPEGDRFGEEGRGLEAGQSLLDFGRVAAAAQAVGLARASLEAARQHSMRVTEGGVARCEHQSVQFLLADMATSLDAASLLTLRAAAGPRPVACEAAMAELFAVETAGRVADSALQIFGALADDEGSPAARRFADARGMRLYCGTPEAQRVLIARELLGEMESGVIGTTKIH